MDEEIADLNSTATPYIAQGAGKHGLGRSNLSRRWKGVCHRLHPDVWLCLKMPLTIESRLPDKTNNNRTIVAWRALYSICTVTYMLVLSLTP